MTMTEAMRERHTVRKYTDKALPQEIIEKLNARIDENNSRFGLAVKLITDSADGLNLFAKLAAKGVKNYFVLAADGGEEAAENARSVSGSAGFKGAADADSVSDCQTV